MAKTITIDDIVIDRWEVDVYQQNVTVYYGILQSDDTVWQEGVAIFWRNIPPADPVPPNWYQLPENHYNNLVSLTVAARQGLLHLVNP